jgi:hypothetical protein
MERFVMVFKSIRGADKEMLITVIHLYLTHVYLVCVGGAVD